MLFILCWYLLFAHVVVTSSTPIIVIKEKKKEQELLMSFLNSCKYKQVRYT